MNHVAKSSLVIFVLMLSTNCKIKTEIVEIRQQCISLITGAMVYWPWGGLG